MEKLLYYIIWNLDTENPLCLVHCSDINQIKETFEGCIAKLAPISLLTRNDSGLEITDLDFDT